MPLTDHDSQLILSRLQAMQADLARSVAGLLSEQAADDGSADSAALLAEREGLQATLDALARQRTSIQAAIDRLKAGVYGLCITCGKPIPPARLEARPEADRCVPCQSRYDRRR